MYKYVHREHAARVMVASVWRFVSIMKTIYSTVVVQTGPCEHVQSDTRHDAECLRLMPYEVRKDSNG